MLSKLIYAGVIFMGFLSIMNPLAGISIFLTLTSNKIDSEVKKIAFTSLITAFCVVLVFALAGHFLLSFFGVSFTALRIAGGILVAIIGYEMLQGKQSSYNSTSHDLIEEKTESEDNSIAITPLGVPLLAGPGVIITAMNFSTGSVSNLISTIIAFGALCVITYFVFVSGEKIKILLGSSTLMALTRMMGLILIVIGTQMLIEGVFGAIQEFQTHQYF